MTTATYSPAFEDLKNQLRAMFQLDRADLDFGIYRIMNHKRGEILNFLNDDLLPQVQSSLAEYQKTDSSKIRDELDSLIKSLQDAGVNPDSSKKVQNYKAQLAEYDTNKLENEIYSDLFNFFKRYYSEGDFMSLRRYKEGVYALPYEGEEVKLYWANHDQYYIKTSEDLKNYVFKLPSSRRVRFQLASASTEKDNNKALEGKDRRFALHQENPFEITDDELVIRFEYRVVADKKQSELTSEAISYISTQKKLSDWNKEFGSLLEKHLNIYTAKHNFDYFIHKDLGGFLKRELDFYIKNEIMHLDDIEDVESPQVEMYLGKIKILRKIANKIITFLAQLEDFQKKLWLKKKFVLETNYCLTLDKIINHEDQKLVAELLQEITGNNKQLEEWVNLFGINDIEDFKKPTTIDFLKNNDKLILDTKFFDREFKFKILSLFDDLDTANSGLLVNSDNFHGLNLIGMKKKSTLSGIYIDPPYNTNSSEIIYKNNYKHSSWISLINDRLKLSVKILGQGKIICVTIDDEEVNKLWCLMDAIFGSYNHLGTACIRINPGGRKAKRKLALQHEYAIFFATDGDTEVHKLIVNPEDKTHSYKMDENGEWFEERNLRKEGQDSLAKHNSKRFYSIFYDPKSGSISTKKKYEIEILPIDTSGNKRIWRKDKEAIDELYENGDLVYKLTKYGNQLYFKFRGGAHEETPKTFWDEKKYSASEHGTAILNSLFGVEVFSFPKSVHAVKDCLQVINSSTNAEFLDFFSGSGTTGHAVISLNREDDGNRKFTLIEMGRYFDTVLKPRIQKVIYSKDWKNGKPVSRDGISHMFKYHLLESYEDTLDNLEMKKTSGQMGLLEANPKLKEEYMLSYMLDMEAQDSLLKIDDFKNPFGYSLRITQDDETKNVNVDLIETFNYLIGLHVRTIDYKNDIVALVGTNALSERTLIIWRDVDKVNNDKLDEWFKKRYSSKDMEFDVIYVNGDNNIENLKLDENTWKVRLIEQEFQKLMFDTVDV